MNETCSAPPCAMPGAAREALALVQAPMIANAGLSRAWSALRRVLDAGDPGSLPDAVADELAGDAPSRIDLHTLHADTPSAANVSYYADKVRKAHALREDRRAQHSTTRHSRDRRERSVALRFLVPARARRSIDGAHVRRGLPSQGPEAEVRRQGKPLAADKRRREGGDQHHLPPPPPARGSRSRPTGAREGRSATGGPPGPAAPGAAGSNPRSRQPPTRRQGGSRRWPTGAP